LAVFLIKEKDKGLQNLTEISNLLLHSGIETVSLEKRHLDLNEAVFLQSRIVNNTQKLMSAESTLLPRSSQIKMGTTNQLLLNKISEVNPYLVERMTR
jgi:phosphotransferase system IIA component